MNKQIKTGFVAVGSMLLAGAASAATDVTAITAAGATVADVGAAVFLVFVGIKVLKWVRRAL